MPYSEARTRYNYPAAHIRAAENNLNQGNLRQTDLQFIRPLFPEAANDHNYFASTMELDQYHSSLLNSVTQNEVILGLASVRYWGNYEVSGTERHTFSTTRLRWFFSGNGRSSRSVQSLGENYIFEKVLAARMLIQESEYGKALTKVTELPFFGRSFASKVHAFMAPSEIGVYDLHIARALQRNDLAMNSTGKMTGAAEQTFDLYCEYLQTTATNLNNSGDTWIDWDGNEHPWSCLLYTSPSPRDS